MRRRDHVGRERGQALVEFAVIVPLFILVVVGLFDGAFALFNYSTLANAARAGARVGVVDQDPVVVEAAVRAEAISLADDRLDVNLTTCTSVHCDYRVEVTYEYEPMTPLLNAIFRPTMRTVVEMPLEFENP